MIQASYNSKHGRGAVAPGAPRRLLGDAVQRARKTSKMWHQPQPLLESQHQQICSAALACLACLSAPCSGGKNCSHRCYYSPPGAGQKTELPRTRVEVFPASEASCHRNKDDADDLDLFPERAATRTVGDVAHPSAPVAWRWEDCVPRWHLRREASLRSRAAVGFNSIRYVPLQKQGQTLAGGKRSH